MGPSIYSGVISQSHGTNFVSGGGFLLSIDLVKLILREAQNWRHDLIDDVALGILLNSKGVVGQNCTRQDAYNESMLKNLNNKDSFLFRCKSDGNRSFDIRALHYVHKLFGG